MDERKQRVLQAVVLIVLPIQILTAKWAILGMTRGRAADPENRHLRRQSSLCVRAQIGTIHSFCTAVIRENSHLLGLEPDFTVAEEDRCAQMKAAALDRLLSRRYETIETDADFRALVDTVGAGRDDSRLSERILSLHQAMQSHAEPDSWARRQQAALDVSGLTDPGETPWGADLLAWAGDAAAWWQQSFSRLLGDLTAEPEKNAALIKAYGPSLTETAAALDALAHAPAGRSWEDWRQRLPVPFPRLSGPRGDYDAALAERVKALRDQCKSAMEELAALFAAPGADLLAELARTRGPMACLLELTLEFDGLYAAAKRRAGVVDFADLEHMACRLLWDSAENAPTALARELSTRYREILVDEYQDVNAVQDRIFTSVSRAGKNLFAVGDVKQSIYRFRLADPGIFLEKYRAYGAGADGPGVRVLLRENFRSRRSILDAANHVFSNLMSRSLGELDYDGDAALVPAAAYPEAGEAPVELLVFPLPEDAGEDSPDRTLFEARRAAGRIESLIRSGARVWENGESRPASWGDVVILLRAPGSAGAAYRRALLERGIPVSADAGAGFFSAPEVAMARSILETVDNPRQDVPLLSALSSPAFGFTPDELAAIRAGSRTGDFFSALRARGETDEKCRRFLALLEELRALAPELPADELLTLIYDRLQLESLCAAMEDGPRRLRNLEKLLDYARRFEAEGYRGLFRFTAWLRRLEERGEEPPAPAEQTGDAVSILSIHKSKGLEFPFVFLCDTGRRFSRRDLLGPVLCHPALGLGPKVIDPDRGLEYPSLAHRAVKRRLLTESLSEELRVLYVAMTRARERLFITCAERAPERTLSKLAATAASPLPPAVLEKAASPARWLLHTALLPDSPLRLRIEPEETAAETADTAARADGAETAPDPAARDRLAAALAWRYAHPAAETLPSKLTATELKAGREADAEAAPLTPDQGGFSFRLPVLTGRERPLTASERGTAAHLVLQYMDFAAGTDEAAVKAEIARLASQGYLTGQQARAVEPGRILRFFRSDVGRRVLAAEKLWREFPFSLLCPASDVLPGGGGDEILLQGVIDCCFLENGALTIVDYKTDAVTAEQVPRRAERYFGQLRAYAAALGRIMGLPVARATLYFLRCGESFDVTF